jgi:hypothetical protein
MAAIRFDKDKGFVSVAQEQRERDEADKRGWDAAREQIQREQDEQRRQGRRR